MNLCKGQNSSTDRILNELNDLNGELDKANNVLFNLDETIRKLEIRRNLFGIKKDESNNKLKKSKYKNKVGILNKWIEFYEFWNSHL